MAAQNTTRWLAGQTLKEFKPAAKPMLVAFGDLETYLQVSIKSGARQQKRWLQKKASISYSWHKTRHRLD
ncbi:MAG: hypothetical protein IPH54_21820 [Rhodoferax sp.]|nr:hypothetical protein [Rhodoferax sp.]